MRNFKVHLILLHQLMISYKTGIDLVNTATDIIKIPTSFNNVDNYNGDYLAATYDIIGEQGGKPYTIRLYARYGDYNDTTPRDLTGNSITTVGTHYAFNVTMIEDDFKEYPMDEGFPKTDGYILSPAEYCKSDLGYKLKDINGEPLCQEPMDAPVIDLIDNPTTVVQNTIFVDPGFTTTDPNEGDLTDKTFVADDIDTTRLGVQTQRYVVMNKYNIITMVLREVLVIKADIPPIISLNPYNDMGTPVRLLPEDNFSDPGATAVDSEGNDISSDIIATRAYIPMEFGSAFTITYRVTDSKGLTSIEVREVVRCFYTPNQPPEIILDPHPNGGTEHVSINYGSVWVEPGYTALDAEDGDITANVVISGAGIINTSVQATYTITYTVLDRNSNMATVNRYVTIAMPPVITLHDPQGTLSDPVNIAWGSNYNEPGYSASDNEDGDITTNVVVSGDTVDTHTPGFYRILYDVTDSDGLTDHKERVVRVLANQPPTIRLIGQAYMPVAWHGTWIDPGATASDVEDGDLTNDIIVSGDTVDTTIGGNYNINYTVTDSGGLSASVSRTVVVADNTPPTIQLVGEDHVSLAWHGTWIDPGVTANDVEDGDLTANVVVSGDTVDTSVGGTYNIVYTVTDSGGLSASVSRTVVVADNTPPVINLIGDNPINLPLSRAPFTRYWAVKGHISDYGAPSYKTVLSNIELLDEYGVNVLTGPYYSYPQAYAGDVPPAFDNDPTTDGTVGSHGTLTEVGFMASSITEYGDIKTLRLTAPSSISNHYGPPQSGLRLAYQDVALGDPIDVSHSWITLLDIGTETWTPGEVKTYDITVNPPRMPKPYEELGATASDSEDGDLTSSIVIGGDTIDTTTSGNYNIDYTVTDSGGLSASVSRTVVVADNTPPVLTVLGDNPLTIPVRGEPFTRYWGVKGKGPSFSKVALAKIEILNQDGVNVITGPYYAYASGNADEAFDGNPNTIGIVEVSGTAAEVGWMGNSIPDHGIITTLKLTAQPDFSIAPQPPVNSIRLVYQDVPLGSPIDLYHSWNDLLVIGNETWAEGETKTYNVVAQPPMLNLPYNDMGATAADLEDGDLTTLIQVSGDTVDVTTPGVYNMTYTVTDSGGLTDIGHRQVRVADTMPTLTVYGPTTKTIPVRTRVWKLVPITASNTAYIKHMKVIDTSGTDVLLNGSTGILGPVGAGGRIYLNDENITVSLFGSDMPKEAAVDMTYSPAEDIGYLVEGNSSLPINKLVVVGIDDQSAYKPQPDGFKLYVGDMPGDVGDDSMTYASKDVDWTLVYETPTDLTWTPGEVKEFTFPEVTPEYTPWSSYAYEAHDHNAQDITDDVIIDDPVDVTTVGTYTVTYSVTNGGHTVSEIRVIVVEHGPTPITLSGSIPGSGDIYTGDYIEWTIGNGAWVDPPIDAVDALLGDLSGDIVKTPPNFSPSSPGVYNRTFTLHNSRGYDSTATQVVKVFQEE